MPRPNVRNAADAPVQAGAGGVVIDVRVTPRAGKSGLAGTRDGALLVRLAAAPVEGAANAELIEVLAGALGVPKRAVTLLSGERSRRKRVAVLGVTVEDARARLMGQGSGAA